MILICTYHPLGRRWTHQGSWSCCLHWMCSSFRIDRWRHWRNTTCAQNEYVILIKYIDSIIIYIMLVKSRSVKSNTLLPLLRVMIYSCLPYSPRCRWQSCANSLLSYRIYKYLFQLLVPFQILVMEPLHILTLIWRIRTGELIGVDWHIYASVDDGLLPRRHQAIIWTNAEILLIGSLGTKLSEILFEIYTFSLHKLHFKMSSGKWRPFYLGLHVSMDVSNHPRWSTLPRTSCAVLRL